MAFDYARNTLGWPRGINGRGLRNSGCSSFLYLFFCFGRFSKHRIHIYPFFIGSVDDLENGVDVQTLQRAYKESELLGHKDRTLTWAGTGVGLLNKIQGAKVRFPLQSQSLSLWREN